MYRDFHFPAAILVASINIIPGNTRWEEKKADTSKYRPLSQNEKKLSRDHQKRNQTFGNYRDNNKRRYLGAASMPP
jgi:hypothetical protein